MALSIAFRLTSRVTVGILDRIVWTIIFALIGVIFGLLVDDTNSLILGPVTGLAGLIALTRGYYLPIYFYLIWPEPRPKLFSYHPVAWDDLCGVPFVGLSRLLEAYAIMIARLVRRRSSG